MGITTLSAETLETIRENDKLKPGKYAVTRRNGKTEYAWSPDGIGCVWFDTLEELESEVG